MFDRYTYAIFLEIDEDEDNQVIYEAKAFLSQCAYWNESREIWDPTDILVNILYLYYGRAIILQRLFASLS